MTTTVKKTHEGNISVRDYIVQEAIKREENLTVCYGDESMVIAYHELKSGRVFPVIFESKFGASYRLVDFPWVPGQMAQGSLF